MPVTVICPHCDARQTAPSDALGTRILCKKCDERFVARRAPGRDDDLDDDRPAARTRARHDDGDDRRPRRRHRDEKPAGSNATLFALIGIGAVVLLLGGGVTAYFVLVKQDKSTTAVVAKADPPKTAAASPAAGPITWVDYAAPDKTFTARFPQQPALTTKKFDTRAGVVQSDVYEATAGPVLTRIVSGGIPGLKLGDGLSQAEIDSLIESQCDTLIRTTPGGREVSRKSIEVSARTARELTYTAEDGTGTVAQVFVSRARFWILLLQNKQGTPSPELQEKFFGGFELK